jgi:5-methyltetrahydrofolate--homocysteine methyltransferase
MTPTCSTPCRSVSVVGDGAMGTQLQAADLTLDDFLNLEGCNEILNEPLPDVIEQIHRTTSRPVRTPSRRNTFGCKLVDLADDDIADEKRELARLGAEVAAKRVGVDSGDELGVPDVDRNDDVDFSGREALQRVRVTPGIRHARRS